MGAVTHLRAVEAIVSRHREAPERLIFSAGLTVAPSVRDCRATLDLLWQLFTAVYLAHDVETASAEDLCFGAVAFKMDRRMGTIGFERLSLERAELEPVSTPAYLDGSPAWVLHKREAAPGAQRLLSKYQSWIDQRIEIARAPGGKSSAAAA